MFQIPLPLPDASLLLTPPWSGLPFVVRLGVLILLAVAPVVLLAWLYRYELLLVSRLTASALFVLRLTVLILLLFLVCLQPVYARDVTRRLPGRVLVVVDRSDSMDVTDPQREPLDKLRLVRALRLAEDLVPASRLAAWIDSLKDHKEIQWIDADEARTDPAKKRQLENERRQIYERVLARADGLTRNEVARRILSGEGVGLLPALQGQEHTVELMGFHHETWDLPPDQFGQLFSPGEEKKANLPDDGQMPEAPQKAGASAFTDIRLPLVRALERSGEGQGKVLGIVLLTDGQHNSGELPGGKARELGERGIPIYPVALGARKPPPDVALVSVRGPNHTLFKDVDAGIDVRFKISGLKAQDFVLELHRAGKEKKLLGQKTITHDGKDREYTESFNVRMDEVGTQTLVASIRPVNPDEKESRLDNNRLSTTVSVADDRARVLLVDGEARWELHYLQTVLQRDRSIELTSVVFDQPRLEQRLTSVDLERLGLPKQELPTGPDALAGYQCVILGDVDATRLSLTERERLERYVADAGGTLIILAGKRYMPLSFPEVGPGGEGDPLRKLLPIERPRVLSSVAGFPISLAQGGREMKFMELDSEKEENEALWAGRPRPWSWAVIGRAKPGATPLAWVADPADEKKPISERERNQAVIARHNYGFGRVLFVGLDSTWRWRYKVGDLYHHRFWGQAIRWAAADKPLVVGNQFLRFGTPQPVYRQGQDVEIISRLTDQWGPLEADFLAGARIIRMGEGPDKKEQAVALVPLQPRPAQPRVLDGKVRDLPAGQYAVELVIPKHADRLMTGPEKDKEPRPLRATFNLLPPESREMIDLETRWPLLEDLATRSGGRVFGAEDAQELAGLLANQYIPSVEHHEQRVYQWWLLLPVIVGLLTLEWVARKWAGLP
jgi:hypothetical protein